MSGGRDLPLVLRFLLSEAAGCSEASAGDGVSRHPFSGLYVVCVVFAFTSVEVSLHTRYINVNGGEAL